MGDYVENTTKKGWLTAILELGAWAGAVLSGAIAELCSRKYGILIGASVFMVGVVIQATAVVGGHDSIMAGRFVTYEPPTKQLWQPLLRRHLVVWELVVYRPSSLFTTPNVPLRKSKPSPPRLGFPSIDLLCSVKLGDITTQKRQGPCWLTLSSTVKCEAPL